MATYMCPNCQNNLSTIYGQLISDWWTVNTKHFLLEKVTKLDLYYGSLLCVLLPYFDCVLYL